MKHIHLLPALCLLWAWATILPAQETFKPLLGDSTVAFAHLDLRKFDLDTSRTRFVAETLGLLQKHGFDERSLKAINRELNVEADKLVAILRPHYEKIAGEFGINELAVVADMELLTQGISCVVAVPWEDKTQADIEALVTYAAHLNAQVVNDEVDEETIRKMIQRLTVSKGLLMLALPTSTALGPDETQSVLRLWLEAFTPSDAAPVSDALADVADCELKLVAAAPKDFDKMIAGLELPPDTPEQAKGLLMFAARKIRWASTGLSSAQPDRCRLTLGADRPADAKQLRAMLDGTIDWGAFAIRIALDAERQSRKSRGLDQEIPELPPLAFELLKGFLRTLLPRVEESKLIFEYSGDEATLASAYVTYGMVTALHLIVIQAAFL